MRRSIPDKEMKALIALSGGICAFPGCGNRLVEPGNAADPAAFLGEMAHIVPDSRQGPRGDSRPFCVGDVCEFPSPFDGHRLEWLG